MNRLRGRAIAFIAVESCVISVGQGGNSPAEEGWASEGLRACRIRSAPNCPGGGGGRQPVTSVERVCDAALAWVSDIQGDHASVSGELSRSRRGDRRRVPGRDRGRYARSVQLAGLKSKARSKQVPESDDRRAGRGDQRTPWLVFSRSNVLHHCSASKCTTLAYVCACPTFPRYNHSRLVPYQA